MNIRNLPSNKSLYPYKDIPKSSQMYMNKSPSHPKTSTSCMKKYVSENKYDNDTEVISF